MGWERRKESVMTRILAGATGWMVIVLTKTGKTGRETVLVWDWGMMTPISNLLKLKYLWDMKSVGIK